MQRLSEVKILQGIPFEKDTNTVLTFDSADEQAEFFSDYAIESFEDLSFVKGFSFKKIRVETDIENVYNANYIMFKNNDDKWFYAYITGFEFVSPNAVDINFELDFFQSYMGEIVFMQSEIEREHGITDNINNYTLFIEEPIKINNYLIGEKYEYCKSSWKVAIFYKPNQFLEKIFNQKQKWTTTNTGGSIEDDPSVATQNNINYKPKSKYDQDMSDTDSDLYGGQMIATYSKVFSGCYMLQKTISNNSDLIKLKDTLNTLASTGYKVINVCMIPSDFNISTYETVKEQTVNLGQVNTPYYNTDKTIGGYLPVNNKCYMYPFVYLKISNRQGDSKDYAFERFYVHTQTALTQISLTIIESIYAEYQITAIPLGYKINPYVYPSGYMPTSDIYRNIEQGISSKKGTSTIWNEDTFIRDSIGTITRIGASALLTGAGIATGNVGAVGMGVSHLLGQGLSLAQRATMPDETAQQNDINSLLQIYKTMFGIVAYQMLADQEEIIKWDMFFSKNGYFFNGLLLRPNVLGRRRFNYVKTQEARISGNIPVECREYVKQKLNEGITFWHDLTNFEYGDFRSTGFVNDIIDKDLTERGTIF